MLFISVIGSVNASPAADHSLFGPKRYERIQGKPWVFTDTFNSCSSNTNQALIRIQNGSNRDSSLSSALISLNGTNVFVESDFKNQTMWLERTVAIHPGNNTLNSQLKSGGQKATPFLVIEILGSGCDSTPPVISTPQPPDGALLNTARPVISASFVDNSNGSGIDPASVRVTMGESDITSACTVGATSVSCTPIGNLAEGPHNVTVAVSDLLKNPASLTWGFTTDTLAPRTAITKPANNQYLGTRAVTVIGSIDDPTATVTVNGKAATINGTLYSVFDVSLAEGDNILTVIARDPVGNLDQSSITVTVDTSLPQVTISAPVDGSFTNIPSVAVSGTASEALASVLVNGRSAAVAGQAFTLTEISLAEGLNSLTVETADRSGNKGIAIVTVNLDTVNPQIFITAPTDGLLTRTSALSVSGSISEPVTSLTINGRSTPVTGLLYNTTMTLAEGQNAITLEATDRSGNKGSGSAIVTLDSTAPGAPTLEGPATPTNRKIVTVSGSAEPWSNVSLYNGVDMVATITTPQDGRFNFAEITLNEGANSFSAAALDPAGNESASSAPLSVTLDTKPPVVGITTPPDKAILNTPVITVSGSIDDPTAAVTVNGLPALNSGETWTLDGFTLQEGSNTLLVEARDPAGNKVNTSVTVTLDTVPPVVTNSTPVDGLYTNETQLTATGTVNEEASSVTVNGVAATISSTSSLTSVFSCTITLTEGTNSIVVTAVDRAGNHASSSATVTLDTIAPQLAVIGPADGALLNNGQIIFGASAAESVVSVLVNGITAQAGTNGYTLPVNLNEGSNSLTVTATDRAGNHSTGTITVNLDSTAPQAPLLAPLITPTRTAMMTVSGQAEALSQVKLFNNGQQIAQLTADAVGMFTVANVTLTEGSNAFIAQAVDAADNASQPSAPLTVVLDTSPPVITVTAPQNGILVSAPQVTISVTVDEALASLTVNGASTTLSAGSSTSLTFEYVLALAAGENSALITAADLAGNAATTTVTVMRDSTPPRVTISAPLNGLMTNTPQIQVSGGVDDAEATLTVGGAPVVITNKSFSVAYLLTDGVNRIQARAVDKAGNEGTAAVSVSLDAQPPAVTLTAPATATAGADVQISVNATDNRGLSLVDLSADGASLWSVAPDGAAAGQSVSLRLSPTFNPGATVTLRARALDAAGNSGGATVDITIDKGADGPGWLQGKVLDDSRGLLLEGAQVQVADAKGQQQSITTPANGGWFFELASGPARVEVVKNGFTTVRRDVTVRPGQRTTVLDSRLTRIDGTVRLVDGTGGTVRVDVGAGLKPIPSVDITIPANALPARADLRLTPVSNQGLIAPLPLGWSPLAAAELRLFDTLSGAPIDPQPLAVPAVLTLPLPRGLGDAPLTAQLARYDGIGRSWLAVAEVAIAANAASVNTQISQISQTGQYALLLADPAPAGPAKPALGAELAAAIHQPSDFSLTTTSGRVVPQAAPPRVGLHAAGDLWMTARVDATTPPALLSGLVVNARITERFDLTSGDKLQPNATIQDIVLYRTSCATAIAAGATEPFISADGLRTTFPVAPSRDFTLVDLMLGKISIAITPPDTSGGVMVGVEGARLLQPDGTALSIPAGALSGTAPVTVATLPEAGISSLVGADFRLLRGIDITVSGQSLKSSATLSIPSPAGFNPALPVVVARKFNVKGGSRLKLVGIGKLGGSIISSDAAITTGVEAIATQGITTSGQYLFLQATAPIGYVSGQITDAAAVPFAGIQVSAQSATLADQATAHGHYLLALAGGAQNITALDPSRGDAASANAAITANARNILNLTVRMVPPRVAAITPANGANNVQPSVPVTVTFSKAMDKNSITAATLVVRDAAISAVPGVITWNAEVTVATFYPAEAFRQENGYSVTIAATVKDLQGYPLGQDVVSGFTIRRTIPPVMPPAGNVTGSFPDADGFIIVTGTQGSAETGNTVLLINDTTGEIQSVTPASNGSFSGKTRGQLGDEIKVVLMDHSGNQTVISYITFKSPDGSCLVTAKGGKVEGEGGSILDIPEGALVGATVLKVTVVQEANLPNPLQSPGKFLGAINIDTGGVDFQKEVHLSIPVPAEHNPQTPVFVTRPGEVTNADGTIEKVYEIIDSTRIINGRITTASPPFDGITGLGSYVFTAFAEVTAGIVSGYTYQEMNEMPGYQAAPSRAVWDELMSATNPVDRRYKYDRPVQGAVIRTPASWNYVSYANANGFYAGFTTLYANVGAPDLEYKLTAIHPQTMRRETVTGYLSADGTMSRNIENINFKLGDKGSEPPDKDPPVISISATLAAGQGAGATYSNGVATLSTEMEVTINVTDKAMGAATLSVELVSEEYFSTRMTPLSLDTPTSRMVGALTRYTFPPNFGPEFSGSNPRIIKPVEPGLFRLIVDAKDAAGNLSSKSLDIRVVRPGEAPDSLDGAPRFDMATPARDETNVMLDAPVVAWFSEAVSGVSNSTFTLFDVTANLPVAAAVVTSVDKGRMKGVLVPRGNLTYGHIYRASLAAGISDVAANSSAGGSLLPLAPLSWQFTTKMPNAAELAGSSFAARDIDYYSDTATGNTYAYVAAGSDGWRVVDISDTTTMQVVWPAPGYKFPYGFDFRNLAVDQQNSRMAMTDNFNLGNPEYHYGYVRFYSLANPEAPVLVGREKLAEAMSGIPQRVSLLNGLAYVCTVSVGIQVVDIQASIDRQTAGGASDGSTIVGAYDTVGQNLGSPMFFIPYRPGAAVMTTTNGYLQTLDLSFPALPTLLGGATLLDDPDSTATPKVKLRFGALAATADFAYRDPASAVLKMTDLAVAGLPAGGIRIVDLSEPSNLKVISSVRNQDGSLAAMLARDIAVNPALGLAIAPALDGVYVIDIRNPLDPRVLNRIIQLPTGETNPDGSPVMVRLDGSQSLVERNGMVYLANTAKGVKAIDLGAGVKISCNPNRPCDP